MRNRYREHAAVYHYVRKIEGSGGGGGGSRGGGGEEGGAWGGKWGEEGSERERRAGKRGEVTAARSSPTSACD